MPVFKGTTEFYAFDATDILSYNLRSRLNHGLLELGAYSNINREGANSGISTLQTIKDERYTDGTVHECYGPSVIWQSGVSNNHSIDPHINVSGIYIDGTFIENETTGASGFYIDYEFGRVVTNSDFSSNTVTMDYSFPEVAIYSSDSAQWRTIINSYNDAFNDVGQISPSGIASRLKENRVWTPCVVVDVQDRSNEPYQLGGGEWHQYAVFYHIFGNNGFEITRIADILNNQEATNINLYNINNAPFPLDFRGALASGALQYNELSKQSGPYFWTKARVETSRGGKRNTFSDIYRGEVIQEISVIRYPSLY